MPISFSSPTRNLFLFGSAGGDVVTNFFKAIDQSASGDDQFVTAGIKFSEYDEKFILGLTAEDTNSKSHGLIEKRDSDGIREWFTEIESLDSSDTVLSDIHIDVNGKLIACGYTGSVPFVAKYSNSAGLEWSSTTNTGNVKYYSIASDSSGQYYACGNTDESGSAQAFIEKYDATGNPGWGKSAFILGSDVVLHAIDSNSRGEVVAAGYLQDTNNEFKGYFVKLDTATGEPLWDRTLDITDRDFGIVPAVEINDVMIDGNDFIYIVGTQYDTLSGDSAGFICKYTPEGNMLWQKETPIGAANSGRWRYNCVEADTETGQIIILGSYFENTTDEYGVLVKYSSGGNRVFTRVLESTETTPPEFGTLTSPKGGMALDADPSFYYVLFTDQDTNTTLSIPNKYTFGKISSSGNGLGAFTYDPGDTNTIEYYIQNIDDRIGRLSDGSVRNDTSDLATNILNPTKIMFDDYATPITNKKRQMNRAGDFEYSGSPAIRPADFQELNLLGDVYSGSGNWLDQSGKGNDGVVNGATHNAAGYWEFDGVDDSISIPSDSINAMTTGDYSVEFWVYVNSTQLDLGNGDNDMIEKWSGVGGYPFVFRYQRSGNLIYSAVYDGTNSVNNFNNLTITTNTWHHVCGVFDWSNNQMILYVDYENVVTSNISTVTGSIQNNSDMYLMKRGSNINHVAGKMGEVRIYPRALTAAQVFQNYNATKSKYIDEAPDTAPKIGPGIVYDNNLLLNYDFGNRATYDRAENLVASSEDFSGSEWESGGTQGKCDVINTDIISPFGTKNVQLLDDTATGTDGSATDERYNIPASNSQDYCFSVYAKKGTAAKFDLYLFYTQTSVVGYRLTYVWDTDFLTGAGAEGANGVAPNYGYEDVGNGWYRFWLSASDQNLNTQVQARIYPASRDTGPTGSTYFWGAQVEKGSTPGRYIRTYGSAITAPTTVKNLSSSSYTNTLPTEWVFDTNSFQANTGVLVCDPVILHQTSNTTGYAWEVWVKINSFGLASEAYLFRAYASGDPITAGAYIAQGGGSLQGKLFLQASNNTASGPNNLAMPDGISEGVWSHFVVTGTHNGIYYQYYNGTQVGAYAPNASFVPQQLARIGSGGSTDMSFGEVRCYDRVLTAAEVSQNFNATRSKYGV